MSVIQAKASYMVCVERHRAIKRMWLPVSDSLQARALNTLLARERGQIPQDRQTQDGFVGFAFRPKPRPLTFVNAENHAACCLPTLPHISLFLPLTGLLAARISTAIEDKLNVAQQRTPPIPTVNSFSCFAALCYWW